MVRRVVSPEEIREIRGKAGLDPNVLPTFAERLRELRQEHGWTASQLATLLKMHRAVPSTWESRGSQPDLPLLLVLADLFGVSLDWLAGRPGAERESALLRAGKAALAERLGREDLSGLSETERTARVWALAQEVAPHAFPALRVAALTGLPLEDFQQAVQGLRPLTPGQRGRFAVALGLAQVQF